MDIINRYEWLISCNSLNHYLDNGWSVCNSPPSTANFIGFHFSLASALLFPAQSALLSAQTFSPPTTPLATGRSLPVHTRLLKRHATPSRAPPQFHKVGKTWQTPTFDTGPPEKQCNSVPYPHFRFAANTLLMTAGSCGCGPNQMDPLWGSGHLSESRGPRRIGYHEDRKDLRHGHIELKLLLIKGYWLDLHINAWWQDLVETIDHDN